MKRYGFMFRIKPELKAEYKKAHDEIWPDNYSIFFRPDGSLFAYFECENADKAFEYMDRQEVNTRWQKVMDKFFIKSDPAILGPEMEDLEEVFHQD
jgi:L-rhamnose mutarotase